MPFLPGRGLPFTTIHGKFMMVSDSVTREVKFKKARIINLADSMRYTYNLLQQN